MYIIVVIIVYVPLDKQKVYGGESGDTERETVEIKEQKFLRVYKTPVQQQIMG